MTTALSALNPFAKPKVKAPPPPPTTPTRAQAAGDVVPLAGGFSSLVSSGASTGLARKAETKKRSLIGG